MDGKDPRSCIKDLTQVLVMIFSGCNAMSISLAVSDVSMSRRYICADGILQAAGHVFEIQSCIARGGSC